MCFGLQEFFKKILKKINEWKNRKGKEAEYDI